MGDLPFEESDFITIDAGVFQLFPVNPVIQVPTIPKYKRDVPPVASGRCIYKRKRQDSFNSDTVSDSFGLAALLKTLDRKYTDRLELECRQLEEERRCAYTDFMTNGKTLELDEYDFFQQKIRGQDPPSREIPAIPNDRMKKVLWAKCKQTGQISLSKNFKKTQICVFCKNNKEPQAVYTGHTLKDSEGHTRCPILRKYPCPKCSAIGDDAHTIKYCPFNDADFKTSPSPLRTSRMATGKKRR